MRTPRPIGSNYAANGGNIDGNQSPEERMRGRDPEATIRHQRMEPGREPRPIGLNQAPKGGNQYVDRCPTAAIKHQTEGSDAQRQQSVTKKIIGSIQVAEAYRQHQVAFANQTYSCIHV